MPVNIYHDWIQRATALTTGQSIHIQCENKEEQKAFHSNIIKELRLLREIDPVEASTIITGTAFKDRRHWVFLKRAAASPYIGFLRDTDGSISRVHIDKENDRYRRLALMIEDGWTRSEIEDAEGITLTDEEVLILWPKMRQDQT
jgi:hypothetical protein